MRVEESWRVPARLRDSAVIQGELLARGISTLRLPGDIVIGGRQLENPPLLFADGRPDVTAVCVASVVRDWGRVRQALEAARIPSCDRRTSRIGDPGAIALAQSIGFPVSLRPSSPDRRADDPVVYMDAKRLQRGLADLAHRSSEDDDVTIEPWRRGVLYRFLASNDARGVRSVSATVRMAAGVTSHKEASEFVPPSRVTELAGRALEAIPGLNRGVISVFLPSRRFGVRGRPRAAIVTDVSIPPRRFRGSVTQGRRSGLRAVATDALAAWGASGVGQERSRNRTVTAAFAGLLGSTLTTAERLRDLARDAEVHIESLEPDGAELRVMLSGPVERLAVLSVRSIEHPSHAIARWVDLEIVDRPAESLPALR